MRPGALSELLREIASDGPASARGWDAGLRAGAVVDRFELVRELGRGGFGVVWEARDRELGRRVAFKAVRGGSRRDLSEERLLHEAEAAARLSHPNIVTLFDVGRAEQGPYLVLELLEGQTLAERMALGALPAGEAVRIALEIAKGLAHAHGHGVVHRDLKPENVFLCRDGQVKVLDFGLAHAFGRPRVEGGTPSYMAPEQLEGAPEDERTDVFALGVILYEMLTGRLPFEDEKALRSPRGAPTLDVTGAPALGRLLAQMLEKEPVRRPRQASEVLGALSSFASELERAPAGPVRRRRTRVGARLIGAAAAVAIGSGLAAGVAWWAERRSSERSREAAAAITAGPGPSIAVLAFADLSQGKDQEYFSDGVAEEILNALTRVQGLRVVGRTSSFSFKGKSDDLRTIGRKLDVAMVLEGSVRRDGGRVRVTAQLVKAIDGYRLWSETYDRELTGIFQVQDDIANAVVAALRPMLLADASASPRPVETTDPEVYTQYLIGRQSYRRVSPDGWRRAVKAYEHALELDPRYAPAWAGLGIPLVYLANRADTVEEARALQRRALAAAEKALELSPDLADGLSVRGVLRQVSFDWEGAGADLERAVRLYPSDADAWRRYAVLLDNLGRMDDAVAAARNAVRLDPLGISHIKLGQILAAAGRGEARAVLERAIEVTPDSPVPKKELAVMLLREGRAQEALVALEALSSADDDLAAEIAQAKHSLGRRAEAEAALDAMKSRKPRVLPLDVAYTCAWMDRRDCAFEWLDRAFRERDSGMTEGFRSDAMLSSLHADPRWKALLRRMNLPVE